MHSRNVMRWSLAGIVAVVVLLELGPATGATAFAGASATVRPQVATAGTEVTVTAAIDFSLGATAEFTMAPIRGAVVESRIVPIINERAIAIFRIPASAPANSVWQFDVLTQTVVCITSPCPGPSVVATTFFTVSPAPAPTPLPTKPPGSPKTGCDGQDYWPTTQKANAVVITHGWNGLRLHFSVFGKVIGLQAPDPASLKALCRETAAKTGSTWDVLFYDWTARADGTLLGDGLISAPFFVPGDVYANALIEGHSLAPRLAGYQNIHFIAHSAGSYVIDKAALLLRTGPSAPTQIGLTFLDAYVPEISNGKAFLGFAATEPGDFVEQYVDKGFADPAVSREPIDALIAALLPFPWNLVYSDAKPALLAYYSGQTYQQLDRACNIDVTKLRTKSATVLDIGAPHGWPIDFYRATVRGAQPGSKGWGFPVADEAGNKKAPCPPGTLVVLDAPPTKYPNSEGN